ncbi:hypothetical protein ACEU6E_04875 [Halorutilales archaeon Cl-col2-1]|nr:hypothetical protein [Halobacteria archaeon]
MQVFGLEQGSSTYWALVTAIGLVVVGVIILNQILSGTLVLKD